MTISTCTRISTAAALCLAGAVASATAAYADTATAALKDSQQGSTAAAYGGGGDCAGYTGSSTLWHFVVPSLDASPTSTGADITGITATFDAGSVTGTAVVQNGKGINVYTDGAASVTDATATLSKPVPDEDAVLVLSHTCAGSGGGSTGGTSTGGTSTGGGTTSGGGTTTGGTSTGGTSTGGTSTGGTSTGGTSTGGDTTGGATGSTGGGAGGGSVGGGLAPVTVTAVDTAPAAAPVVDVVPAAAPAAAAPALAGDTSGAATATATSTRPVAAATAGQAQVLPFTGAPIGLVPVYGLLALVAGVLMQLAGRFSTGAHGRLVYRGRHATPTLRTRLLLG